MKKKNKQKLLIISLTTIGTLLIGINKANAQISECTASDSVCKAINDSENVAMSIIAMLGAFTQALIAPMGIGAAAKIFRHVVLANV